MSSLPTWQQWDAVLTAELLDFYDAHDLTMPRAQFVAAVIPEVSDNLIEWAADDPEPGYEFDGDDQALTWRAGEQLAGWLAAIGPLGATGRERRDALGW